MSKRLAHVKIGEVTIMIKESANVYFVEQHSSKGFTDGRFMTLEEAEAEVMVLVGEALKGQTTREMLR